MKSAVDYYFQLGDALAKQKAEAEANRKASLFNELYPQTVHANIEGQRANQRLREAQTLHEQLLNMHPELSAGREGQQEFLLRHFGPESKIGQQIEQERRLQLMPRASSDPLAKQNALLNVVRSTPEESVENRLARAELNNMAAAKMGPSITIDGKTVSLGGQQPANLFQTTSGTVAPEEGPQISTAAAPMARGRAGITIREGDEIHSIPTSADLSKLQQRALALQSILRDLHRLPRAAEYSTGLGIGKGEEMLSGLSAALFPSLGISKRFRDYQDAQAVLAKTTEGLASFFNVPKTNEGIQTISKYIGPHRGDSVASYSRRLRNIIIPALRENYDQVRESLTRGVPLNIGSIFKDDSNKVRVRNIRTGRTGRVKKSDLDKVLRHGDWVVAHE